MRRVLICLLIPAALMLGSCSDDETHTVDPFFKVVFEVKDPAGNPVPDLELELTSNNPYLQDFGNAKALTRVRMTVPIETHVRLRVQDIYGETVKTLVDGVLAAGLHETQWNANLPDGGHMPSGRYTFRMTAFAPDGEGVLFEDSQDVLMCLFDPWGAPIATTDAQGRIVLDDMRYFPHLFAREEMRAYDETALDMGPLQPTEEMIVSLLHPDGPAMRIVMDIPGSGFYPLVWDPVTSARSVNVSSKSGPRSDTVVPPVEWKLGPIYPNPFN